MQSMMKFITFVALIPAACCSSGTSSSHPGDTSVAKETATDRNLKKYVFDNAIVADESRRVTMTEGGDGTSGDPNGIDFDFGDPMNSKAGQIENGGD